MIERYKQSRVKYYLTKYVINAYTNQQQPKQQG